MFDILQIALSNAVLVTAAAPVVWGLARVVKQPAFTHVLWVIVLLKLLTPPLFLIPVHLLQSRKDVPMPTERVGPLAASEPESRSPTLSTPHEFQDGLLAPPHSELTHLPKVQALQPLWWQSGDVLLPTIEVIWISGSLICLGIASIRMARFLRMLRHATFGPADAQRRVNQLAQQLNVNGAPTLWLIRGTLCPMLWALGQSARLLVPVELWNGLEPVQRDAIVMHELAHWRRRDHWIRWLELLATSLFWWNPTCWWARHELREAEEQCCDAWVLWAMGDFRHYANALLKAVEFVSIRAERPSALSAAPALASGMGQFGHLKRRIIMLKNGNVSRALSWSDIAAAFTLGAMLLPISPSLAQVAATNQQPQQSTSSEPLSTSQTNFPASADKPAPEEAANMERQLRDAKREIDELSRKLQEAESRVSVLRANHVPLHGQPAQVEIRTPDDAGPSIGRTHIDPSAGGQPGSDTTSGSASISNATAGTGSFGRFFGAESPRQRADRFDRIEAQLRDLLREVENMRTEAGIESHPVTKQ